MSKAAFKRNLARRSGRPALPPRRSPDPPEPTDQQLARFAAVVTHGTAVSAEDCRRAELVLRIPFVRARWLRAHREFQERMTER